MTKAGKIENDDEDVRISDGRQSLIAAEICRGTVRLFTKLGHASLAEMPLPNAQRADIIAVTRTGKIIAVEIKSSLNDFRTDQKWTGYRDYCDELSFAVKIDFPVDVLPEDAGLILADKYGAEIVRAAPHTPLATARRKTLTLRFARASARRLSSILDPALNILPNADPDD